MIWLARVFSGYILPTTGSTDTPRILPSARAALTSRMVDSLTCFLIYTKSLGAPVIRSLISSEGISRIGASSRARASRSSISGRHTLILASLVCMARKRPFASRIGPRSASARDWAGFGGAPPGSISVA